MNQRQAQPDRYPGKTLRWNDMIEAATGEPLTPAYYVQQFIGEPVGGAS